MENIVHELTNAILASMNLPSQPMRIILPIEMLQTNGNQWNHTLIFTLMNGKHLNPNQVMRAAKIKWKVIDLCDIVRAGHNRFVCRFYNINDHERVEEQQPWIIMGCLVLMEEFSTDGIAANVRFETLPLWMSFRGLELEHLHTETVKMIGSVVGIVQIVLPVGVIPRTVEGYRARVRVFVHLPLVQGYTFNTLSKGDVWISYKYNNLPSLYCYICLRLGHNKSNCDTPPIDLNFNPIVSNDGNQNTDSRQVVTFPDDQQALILWPHQQNIDPSSSTINVQTGDHTRWEANMGERVEENSEILPVNLAENWNNLACNQANLGQAFGPQQNSALSDNEVQMGLRSTDHFSDSFGPNYDTMFGLNAHPTHAMLDPTEFSNGNRGGTLVINEPNEEATTTRRGRGRPPGSLNKIQKNKKYQKGKGKVIQENYGDYVLPTKKRKLINDDTEPSLVVTYDPEEPKIVQNQRNQLTNQPEETNCEDDNEEALDLMSQMISNPSLTNINSH
ncbi:hypothetical protein FRX31_010832 [Thalictrum thalictroides]|uniref:DUF4283 domain-containing protein n=1 Tax=Thalictrum thalictroides TaxID=46969 RepID=A0A7J6WQE3_THATH|nr:hypothetical protein FRX31_010832 [Thalictrum thalictroides]